MIVYVIHVEDLHDKTKYVIGVAHTISSVDRMINEYYGPHDVVSFNDIRDSDIEFVKIIKLHLDPLIVINVKITVQTFELNKL